MDCYAKGYCKLYNTAKCTNMCDFKVVLYNLQYPFA